MSNHSSRASDGSRPADDVSQRPGTRIGATEQTAAGENVSSHSSRATGESKPFDGIDRRPEIPTGVGPIINNRDRVEILRMAGTRHSLYPAPEEGVTAIFPAARASVFLKRKRRPERCTTRSWPRSQGHPGPWPPREQQQDWT